MKAEEIERVGVVGCGVMGSGIVEVCARAGMDVVFVEASPGLVERGRALVEASTEDADTKRDVFRRLDEVTPPDAVLASNTSSIPIVELASVTKRPEKVLGMHFFNPVPVMGLIELVRAITTSEETVELGRAFGVRLGKTTVESRDRAGFIVNMLLIPYLNGAI